jgi:hypothetical protein
MLRNDRNVQPLPSCSGRDPLSGGLPSLCPLVHAAPPQCPRDIRSADDTPAAGDHPARWQPWRHPQGPPPCGVWYGDWPPESARQHAPVSPAAGGAVMRRRARQPPPTPRHASDGELSSVPVAQAERLRGPSCPCPRRRRRRVWRTHSHIERSVSFWDRQRDGCGGVGSGGRGRIQGLPQSLGARVPGGGASAPSLRRVLPVRAAARALRRRGVGRCHEERLCLA